MLALIGRAIGKWLGLKQTEEVPGMQELGFSYSTDGVSQFSLTLSAEGDRITRQDLVLMGDYIHLLFMTIKRIGGTDIDAMIDDLLKGDDELHRD